MDYKQERKQELAWYGFSEKLIERYSTGSDDVVLQSGKGISLIMNSDLRYCISLGGSWAGLLEMKQLYNYLVRWTITLDVLRTSPHYRDQLVPPGEVLHEDGNSVYFMFYQGEHTMMLDHGGFTMEETRDIFHFLDETSDLRDVLEERNDISLEEKYH